jgi:hypothetical protein
MDYGLLFQKLHENNIRYVVCGGLAVNLHGIPRMTADIDIILDLKEDNLSRFEKCVSALHYKLHIPIAFSKLADELERRNLIESKNLTAVSFFNYDKNYLTLDVLINFPIPFEDLWNEKQERKDGNIILPVVSIDHLIKLKEYSNRAVDKQDVILLSRIKNGK